MFRFRHIFYFLPSALFFCLFVFYVSDQLSIQGEIRSLFLNGNRPVQTHQVQGEDFRLITYGDLLFGNLNRYSKRSVKWLEAEELADKLWAVKNSSSHLQYRIHIAALQGDFAKEKSLLDLYQKIFPNKPFKGNQL